MKLEWTAQSWRRALIDQIGGEPRAAERADEADSGSGEPPNSPRLSEAQMEAQMGEALVARSQIDALLAQHALSAPSQAALAAHRGLVASTRSLLAGLGFGAEELARPLFHSALHFGRAWALREALVLAPKLASERLEGRDGPAHWPLTLAAQKRDPECFAALAEAGASWEPDGRPVLTGIEWSHAEHPIESGRLPWWVPLLDDDRRWSVYVDRAVDKELDEQFKDKIAGFVSQNPEMEGLIGFLRDSLARSSESLELMQEPARGRPGALPSRQAILAALFTPGRLAPGENSPPTGAAAQSAFAAFARMGLDPNEEERQAILALRARTGERLDDLPAGWSPAVASGEALWALLAASRWERARAGQPDGWCAAGRALREHDTALAGLARAAGRDPAVEWFMAEAKRFAWRCESGARSGAENSSAARQELSAGLSRLADGAVDLFSRFPTASAPDLSEGWARARDALDLRFRGDAGAAQTDRARARAESDEMAADLLFTERLAECEERVARAIGGSKRTACEEARPTRGRLRI
jgi:hypothetical protein